MGFGIYFIDKQDNKIKCFNVDLVSESTQQSAITVIRSFEFIRLKEFFKNIEKNRYIIWADTGSHFRNNELVHYFFTELAQSNIRVELNFFGDKHGKNQRDTHFSAITNFIKTESLISVNLYFKLF